MQSNCWTFLVLVASIYCLRAVHSFSISRTDNEDVEGDGDFSPKAVEITVRLRSDEDPNVCNTMEPCLFVMTKRNPYDNSVKEKHIPSWCHCRQTEVCRFSFYDKKKKAKTFRCQSRDVEMENDVEETLSSSLSSNSNTRRHMRRFRF